MADSQPQESAKESPKGTTPVPVTIVVSPTAAGEMKVSEPLPVKEVPKTSREAAMQWLAQQGVSTVLLFSIVVLFAFGIPKYVIPSIQAGYERNASSYEKTMQMQIEARDRLLKQTWDEHGRDRETFREAVRDIRQK